MSNSHKAPNIMVSFINKNMSRRAKTSIDVILKNNQNIVRVFRKEDN